MKTYGQFCALAKALDVIGDRWSLLIVRELIIRGEARYTDIRDGLPGIASNLLSTRLKELEEAEVIERFDAPPPVATPLFRLTARGKELEAVMIQIGRWGEPMLAKASKSDVFCAHWITLPARRTLRDNAPDEPPVVVELRAGEEPVTVKAMGGTVRVSPGAAENPDAIVAGPPRLMYEVLSGKTELAHAQAAGLKFTGDTEALRRMLPRAVPGKPFPKTSSENSSDKRRSSP